MSEVILVRQALSLIAKSSNIESINEDSPEGRIGLLWIDDARKETLSLSDWSFARRFEYLNISSEAPVTSWEYRYVLPSNCLVPRAIENAYNTLGSPRVPFLLESDQAGNTVTLLCNEPDALLRFTRDVANYEVFSPLAKMVLRHVIAYYICFNVSGKENLADKFLNTAVNLALRYAEAVDAAQGAPNPALDASWVRVR